MNIKWKDFQTSPRTVTKESMSRSESSLKDDNCGENDMTEMTWKKRTENRTGGESEWKKVDNELFSHLNDSIQFNSIFSLFFVWLNNNIIFMGCRLTLHSSQQQTLSLSDRNI